MKQSGSLKLRLIFAAALGISISLIIAGSSFYIIFQRYVERAAIAELENHFTQLVASIRVDDAGTIKARSSLSDPRFQKPYGGLYWQINESSKSPLRSRSLFDDSLPVPDQSKVSDVTNDVVHLIDGPELSTLFALEKIIVLPNADGTERKLNITMAIDRNDIDSTVRSFGRDLIVGLGTLYAALLSGALLQIFVGLRPLEALRKNIEKIRQGSAKNIIGDFPSEVEPLVSEVNALISERETQLQRARQRASNLAHGLKTPLTIMSAVADSIEASSLKREAQDIRDSADQMRQLVERELSRARMASGHSVQQTPIAPIVARMVNALKKTSVNDTLLWHSSIPADATFAMEPDDLLECVGNLLENARKWAKSQIFVSWNNKTLKIEDDGPGVPDNKISSILERGVRLDETVAGSGLGLGIVAELVEIYGLDIKLSRSSLGGLSVSIGKNLALQD
jgi:signal transduction histidine kinase